MADASYHRKKRSILINPRFQWTLIGYAAGVAFLILFLIYAFFSLGFHEFRILGHDSGIPADNVYYQFIQMQEATFVRVLVALAVLVAGVLVIGGLIVSHKIAGPIYRMQKEFLMMTEREPPVLKKIIFRKGDYFPELAEAYNALAEKMKR